MSAQIQSIAEWMATVIKLTGPTIRPDVAYVQASGMAPIQELPANGNDSMREFQIQAGPIAEMGAFIGPCYEQWREMDVVMRYVFDLDQGDEWREVDRMAADDFDRINLALPRPPLEAPWSSAGVWNILFVSHDKLAKSPRIKGVWEQKLTFRVLYSVTDLVQDWTYSIEYNTLTALKAALTGRPVGTTARLVNARTSDLIGVWKMAVAGIKACPSVDFAKADGTEFADGSDIISQGAGTWSITYGTGLVVATDAAEFYGYAETSNSDILGTGTHTTYARDEVQTYTSQVDIDAVTGTTDQVVALVGSDGTLTNRQAWNGSVFVRQTRHGEVDVYASQVALEADSPSVDGDCRRDTAQTYVEQLVAGTWTQLGIVVPSVCAADGYTDISLLHAAAGTDGGRAVLWQVAGGKPLIWFAKHLRSGEWVPTTVQLAGLTAAERAVIDALNIGDAIPWDTIGYDFSGATRVNIVLDLYRTGAVIEDINEGQVQITMGEGSIQQGSGTETRLVSAVSANGGTADMGGIAVRARLANMYYSVFNESAGIQTVGLPSAVLKGDGSFTAVGSVAMNSTTTGWGGRAEYLKTSLGTLTSGQGGSIGFPAGAGTKPYLTTAYIPDAADQTATVGRVSLQWSQV